MKYLQPIFGILAVSVIVGSFYVVFRHPHEPGSIGVQIQQVVGRCLVACAISFFCLVLVGVTYVSVLHFMGYMD